MTIEKNKKRINPKNDSPAVYIPCWLIQVSSSLISTSAKMLYGRLSQWSSGGGIVHRSTAHLSVEMGVPIRNVERYLKELRDAKLIGSFQAGSSGVNHFEFYDHEWMHEPIKEELSYPQDSPKLSALSAKIGERRPPKMAHLNIKEIKINNIGISNCEKRNSVDNSTEICKTPNSDYSEFDGQNCEKDKSDYLNNNVSDQKNASKLLEDEGKLEKSDYYENQAIKKTTYKNKQQFDVNCILEDNIYQIPEQFIRDWLENRKKKKSPITQTAWKGAVRKLGLCKEKGIDPVDAFEMMVERGWISLEVDWIVNLTQGNNQKKPSVAYYPTAAQRQADNEALSQREAEWARRKREEIADSKQFQALIARTNHVPLKSRLGW